MKSILKFIPIAILALFALGCSQNYYNIPRESYERNVRVLGVAPFFTDDDSDIRHPEKETLIPLLKDLNRKNELELVARLKTISTYSSVRFLESPADQLFSSLFFRRERRRDEGLVYNKYFFRQKELKQLLERNKIDAVMLVTVSGVTKEDRIFSSNLLSSLKTDFNYIIMTAQILDADNNILWEYPNFHKRFLSYSPLINLQYPDFDEAAGNSTDRVEVKFKTLPGITRTLTRSKDSSFIRDLPVSRAYNNIFNDMIFMLEPEFKFEIEDSPVLIKPAPVMAPAPAATRPVTVAPQVYPQNQQTPQPPRMEPVSPVPDTVSVKPGEIKSEDLLPEKK